MRVLVGEYLIVHNQGQMDAGGPCTIYRVGGAVAERIVSFTCIPHVRPASNKIVLQTIPAPDAASIHVDDLVEYQFAGDTEGHGVPR